MNDNNKYKFFYFTPIFNIIIDSFTIYFDKGSLLNIFRGVVLYGFLVYVLLNEGTKFKINKFIFFYTLYIIILIPFSSDIPTSIRMSSKVFVTLLMFDISFLVINDIEKLKKMNIALLIVLIIVALNIFLGITMHIGKNAYFDDDELRTGNLFSSDLYPGSFALVFMPIILPFIKPKNRFYIVLLGIAAFILIILNMRRTAIFIVLNGYLLYTLLSKYKIKMIVSIVGVLTILLLLLPLYEDEFMPRFEARNDRGAFNYETLANETRYFETLAVVNERFLWKSPIKSLFGEEVFNSTGNYGRGRFGDRVLHLDYNVIIHGSGFVGLILYLSIFYSIYQKYKHYHKYYKNKPYYHNFRAIFLVIFISSFIVSFDGGMVIVSFRSIMFIYMGAILSIFYNNRDVEQNKELLSRI